ncbi:hypothetical protein [Bremerella alba]|uniref:Carboxypeptidase regulatory-like domain-containing protein n=1 Tax=Bremerella alba TaxID=980252 RepID=A0A7V9A9Y8_9BACT|nr:hypothetical protein [Bremerella alba]MBA2117977.1 hypothetical protein [Bremerella alba]
MLFTLHASRFWLALVTIVLLGATFGCGGKSDSGTYPISGTVTYQGKPVPVGSLTLVPDSSQGNRGAAVSMEIVDGKFDSANASRGHVGGPHLATIVGLDGNGDDDLFPMGYMLFQDYQVSLDLPQEESTQDIVVPTDRKKPGRRSRNSSGP